MDDLKKWRQSAIRGSLADYRKSLENYHIGNKRVVDLPDGRRAFSLLSPALDSPPARRRARLIVKNIVDNRTKIGPDGRVRSWGSRTPHFLTTAVTYQCQCRCAHCSAEAYRKAGNHALDTRELSDAVAQAVDLGTTCVVFTGGEPLLRADLPELIAAVDPERSVVTLFTNGELFTAKAAQDLREAGLFGVFVSLDSADPAAHDANRGRPGLFAKAAAAVGHCREAGMLPGISGTVTREKIENGDLDALMETARDLGAVEVFLFDMIATGRLEGEEDVMLDAAAVARVRAFRERYNALPDFPRIIHQTMFTSIAYPCTAEGCPAGVAQMHLRANGDISPCDFTPFSFGNVRERPVKDIWGKISSSPLYAEGSPGCRMADPAYRERCKTGLT